MGPFFGMALPYPGDSDLVDDAHPQAVRLHGTVYDGAGVAVPDALVELWQPDSAGRIPRQRGSLRRDGTGEVEELAEGVKHLARQRGMLGERSVDRHAIEFQRLAAGNGRAQ